MVDKLKCALLIILSCLAIHTWAQPKQLSDQAMISLLTCEQGDELYSIFGHSAIRVKDPVHKLDIVYNYGTFDFDTPNFYPKFIKGQLNYTLSVTKFRRFVSNYERDNRDVTEQLFVLDSIQKNRLFAFLQDNMKPEKRNYRYDFFFDNCATRIRDIFPKTFPGEVRYKDTLSVGQYSFRKNLDYYLRNSPWADFGIDFILGLPTDDIMGYKGKMFLPDHLRDGLKASQIDNVPLISRDKVIFEGTEVPDGYTFWTPSVVLWLLCLLYAIVSIFNWSNWAVRLMDILLFGLLGIAGFFLLFMWFGTRHVPTHQNLNLMWAFPLHLGLAFQFFRKGLTTFWWYYFWGLIIVNILLLVCWFWWPQQFNVAIIPIIIAMLIRGFEHVWAWE